MLPIQCLSSLCIWIRTKNNIHAFFKGINRIPIPRAVRDRTQENQQEHSEEVVFFHFDQKLDLWVDERPLPLLPIQAKLRSH